MKLPRNRESGQVLITALILLALGSLLIVPGLNLAVTNLKYHELIERKTLESYSADSGVQYVLYKLYNNPGRYTEEDLVESFTINDRTVNVTATYMGNGVYKVTSTATSANGRSTSIESYLTLSVGVFSFAVAAKDNITLENVIVDSSPEENEGHIHSNGNISLAGGVVNGDATAVGTISGWQGVVTGVVTDNSSWIVFPGDYSQLYKNMAKEGVIWDGDYTVDYDRDLGPIYIDGNLFIRNYTVTLTGTVYVTGSITVELGHLDGDENVLAEGNINIEGGGYGADYIPIITSISGNITLEKPAVDAVIYAPYGEVRFENVHLYGAVGGKTIYIESSNITYAKQLQGRQDIPGGELATVAYNFR